MLRAFAAPLRRHVPRQEAFVPFSSAATMRFSGDQVPEEERPFLHHQKKHIRSNDGGVPPAQTKFKPPRKRASKLFGELQQEAIEKSKEQFPGMWAEKFRVGDAVELKMIVQGGIHQVERTSKEKKEMEKAGSTELYQETEKIRGVVIAIVKRGLGSSVLLRDHVFGTAIERRIPLYAPSIMSVKVLERNFVYKGKRKVKRSKLYYFRDMNPLLTKVSKY